MGNAPTPTLDPPARPPVPRAERFSARFLGHAFEAGSVAYDFLIEPPRGLGAPGHVVRRTYAEFQDVDSAMAQRHRGHRPPLPSATFLEYTDPEFIAERAAGLEGYLEALLVLEPLPRVQALRHFLSISQPLSLDRAGACAAAGPLAVGSRHLPLHVVVGILTCIEALRMLRVCGAVCRTMRVASLHPACWPSLRFRSSCAERWLDGLQQLLAATCGGMQALALDLAFENPRLAVALPGGLSFGALRHLALRMDDAEAVHLADELLECMDSPWLQRVSLEGLLTEGLISALCRVSLSTSGGLLGLKLLWAPQSHRPLQVDRGQALAVLQVLAATPALEELAVGLVQDVRGLGVARSLAVLDPPHVAIPGTQPMLANASALTALQHLTFDFISDDVLVCLRGLDDRTLCVRSARLSGLGQIPGAAGRRGRIAEPDEALALLLDKLGDGLEEFELIIELGAAERPFSRGFLRPRIGPLPGQWQNRDALRSLSLNWTAFDEEGVQCIVENCPRLQTLLLDRSEYWTDTTVALVVHGLPELQHFRLRSSAMLSDRALGFLEEITHRLVSLELERSYSMSTYKLEQLQHTFCPGRPLAQNLMDYLDPTFGVVSLMAAASGLPDPDAPTNTTHRRQYCSAHLSSSKNLLLLEPEADIPGGPPVILRTCRLQMGRW